MKKLLVIIIALIMAIFSGCVNNQLGGNLDKELKEFMEEKNILLTGKEVQYDMENHLDETFAIKGQAELYNYYNYGFRGIEKDFFCIRVEQDIYSEGWYVYMDRKSFAGLYEELMVEKVEVIVECFIPKSAYEKNMDNLSLGLSVKW